MFVKNPTPIDFTTLVSLPSAILFFSLVFYSGSGYIWNLALSPEG